MLEEGEVKYIWDMGMVMGDKKENIGTCNNFYLVEGLSKITWVVEGGETSLFPLGSF